jgi:D-alanyl-lipoteichoic acid acyltransferase DltB (MBOAT superfamily)
VRLDSAHFLAIFAMFFLLHSAAPGRLKRLLLVLGSVLLYATLSLRFVPLFLAVGLFTFYVAARLHHETSETRRRRLLWLGVGANVLLLAYFKGSLPAAQAAARLPVAFGVLRGASHWLAVVQPLGLSFYTLQAISYIVDVDRGIYQPPKSLLSFLASFTLFPHLMAGPIVRSSFLVPQIEAAETVTARTAKRALILFLAGLAKKTIADRLAPLADSAFDATHAVSALGAWTSLIAYAGQLYGDFSGYTDMATALALLLGLELPPNFNLPYLATSPADFWRRWHISLSAWLRDYVYLPLGVRFRRHRYAPIVVTWLLAGLWHGASWLFLLYGLYHGVLLAVTAWLVRRFPSDEPAQGLRRFAQTIVTFYFVLVGYVLFRAPTIPSALRFLVSLHSSRAPSVLSSNAVTTLLGCAAAIVFCHLLDHLVRSRRTVIERTWIVWPAMVATVTFIVLFGAATQPFIYFQF